ncbi:bifunctional 3-deoxy-7-phosphoheptulonate synthase/chorismate mutase [Candidatus Neomarinimicrobiota bacterium]
MNKADRDLPELRDEIDHLDEKLLELLAERNQVVKQITDVKADRKLPLLDPERETEMFKRFTKRGKAMGLSTRSVQDFFRTLLAHSHAQQEGLQRFPQTASATLTYQGGRGSYSWLAAQKHFGDHAADMQFMGFATFRDVYDSVVNGSAEFGILPLENTIVGSVQEVYDLLARGRLAMVGEEILTIDHCLIGLPGSKIEGLRTIMSHPMALNQCSRFLESMPSVRVVHHVDTAEAVELVKTEGDPAVAAIASREAAELHGLDVLKDNVANSEKNYTRFALMCRTQQPLEEHWPQKTSLLLHLAHKAGALAHVLEVFSRHGINLTKLESRPILSMPWEYGFFLDFEGNVNDSNVESALEEIRPYAHVLRVLGTYINRKVMESPALTDEEGISEPESIAAEAAPELAGIAAPASPPPVKLRWLEKAAQPERQHAVVTVGDVKIGSGKFRIIAGPCAVESADQLMACAEAVKSSGAHILRGGLFKPRTSPHSFQGLGWDGLELMVEARKRFGLPIVTEVMTPTQVERIAQTADLLQIGARNMQNFDLLRAAGQADIPVLLKRGLMASLDELLYAAEYVITEGNQQVILCERGIRTFETATRFTLDLSAVPVLKERTHLPVCVDPSHAAGERSLVMPLARAARAVGADAIMVEIHPDPEQALCDGPQALLFEDLKTLVDELV